MAIKGWGSVGFVSTNGKLFVSRPNSIEIASDLSAEDVPGYPFTNPSGTLQIVDSYNSLETFKATIKTASFDKIEIQRMMDQFSTVVASGVTLPEAAEFAITTATMPVAGLVADQAVAASIQSDTAPIQLTQGTIAPATANAYQVTAGNIVFNAAQVGKTVAIQYLKAFTNVEIIGNTDNPIGDLMFFGRIIGTRFAIAPRLYIPRMTRRSGINIGGKEASVEYRLLLKAGFNRTFQIAFDQA
jgi:hypothetical protein